MKIKVIMPDKAMDRETLDLREAMLRRALSPGVEISVDCIKAGPDELDCHTDEVFAGPELVREAVRAQQEGWNAVVVYCFSDVAVDALRENVDIPVIGPGETAVAAASMVCNRFTVITTEQVNVGRTYRRLMKNPIAREKMTSVRPLNIPMAELREDPHVTVRYLEAVCRKAVEEEQVDGVILGCLGMAWYGQEIEAALPVKVFDPAFIAVAYAELCVRLKLSHNRAVYPQFVKQDEVGL